MRSWFYLVYFAIYPNNSQCTIWDKRSTILSHDRFIICVVLYSLIQIRRGNSDQSNDHRLNAIMTDIDDHR